MRIFVTGASGFIGSAVVPQLIAAGHTVVGLARSEASADALVAAGAEVHRGSLQEPESLRPAAEASDGIIHLAYIHDFTTFDDNARVDREAIAVMGSALKGSGRPLIITGGTAGLPAGSTERDVPPADHPLRARADTEEAAMRLADEGVRVATVRLAPTVHGPGDHGFMAAIINAARTQGVAGFVGDGANRWPAVHRLDAAVLFRLAVEGAPAGTVLHGIADEGVPLKDIAEVIGRHLDLPVRSISPEDAPAHFGWLAGLLSVDIPTTSALTRESTGWAPTHPGLIEDLELGHYFTEDGHLMTGL